MFFSRRYGVSLKIIALHLIHLGRTLEINLLRIGILNAITVVVLLQTLEQSDPSYFDYGTINCRFWLSI